MSNAEDDPMSGSDSDTGDSDVSFEEIEASEEDMQAITDLEAELQANSNLYEKHVEYISLLRKCKMKARLFAAREAMHVKFPLSESLWLEWLDDEIASGQAQKAQKIQQLFATAVQDYLSIPIWLKYIRFVAESDPEASKGSPAGLEKLRGVYEAALSAGGLHFSLGSQLWNLCRETELRHSASAAPSDPENPVLRLFHRQLQVPLVDNFDTESQLRTFLGVGQGPVEMPEQVKKGQAKAQTMAQARVASEESVAPALSADTELLANYMAYIRVEEASGEPQRVQCMYERAVARFPVTHVLWLQYAQYLEQHLPVSKILTAVYARAVRNCPWIGSLWARALRASERAGLGDEQHEALYASALAAGLESPEDYMDVSLARLDALRRKGPGHLDALRAAFQATDELMQSYFPDYIDRSLRIPSYWAACELELGGGHAAACQVWEAALRTHLNMYAEPILGYVAMELGAKRLKEARSIFRKYHRRPLHENGGLAICEAWLRFEREHGSAEDHLQAVFKTEPVLSQALAAATAAANPQAAAESKAAVKKAPKAELSKAEKKRLRQEKDPNFKGKAGASSTAEAAPVANGVEEPDKAPGPKRKARGIGFDAHADNSKRQKGETPTEARQTTFVSSGAQEMSTDVPDSAAGASQPTVVEPRGATALSSPADKQPVGQKSNMGPPQPRPPKPGAGADSEHQEPASHSEASGSSGPAVEPYRRKCYVKGISSTATVQAVQEAFEAAGRIVDFSMPLDRKSNPPHHRGFAYITFASSEGLQNALRMDGREVSGHSLSVAVAHQEVAEGQREAFVLNIPPTADAAAIETLLGVCGPIKSLRMPLDKASSQIRGFAYVEFEDTQGLQKAVDMTGIDFQGRSLKISISNQPMGGGSGRAPMRGGRGPPRGGRSRGGPGRGGGGGRQALELESSQRTPAFRPRSVSTGQGPAGQKSNDDFRAMLKK